MYDFVSGPMFWLSIAVFLVGIAARLVWYFRGLSWQGDRVAYWAYPKLGFKGAVRSIFYWLLPFGTQGWRKQPFMTVVFFGFHFGAVLVPIFLLAHNLFLKEKLGFALFLTLPQTLADVLSWAVIISAVLLILRRIALPEVRILTTAYDYLILLIAVAPFVTGLLARYEVGNYSFWLMTHMICGEILLLAVPFTKLSHIVLFFASRAQLGMDYGIKRSGLKGTQIAW